MEASVRILLNSSIRQSPKPLHHLLKGTPLLKLCPKSFLTPSYHHHHRSIPFPPASLFSPRNHHPVIRSEVYVPPQGHQPSIPFGFSNTLLSSQFHLNPLFSSSTFFRIFSDPNKKPFEWNHAQNGIHRKENGALGEKGPIVTAVLLGWLGSKPKHLRRYVELYNSRGIHAITFVTSIKDVLSFGFGKNLEERILGLTHEVISWLSESQKDGRERFLVFHAFSNAGWLGYGAILDNLLSKPDLLVKIKGCVVDSGPDPSIDPKVWAAGFTAALLQKKSSSAYPSFQAADKNASEIILETSKIPEPLFIETLLLSAFEKLLSYLLNLPDVNQRLTKIISTLSKNQPCCPQLYLYSTADKVISYQSVESFIEDQGRRGRNGRSFNFGTSPHVDHYRKFPYVYSSEIEKFLDECLFMVKGCKTMQL